MGILELMKERRIYFDGGMGSLLQARGLKPGELPESFQTGDHHGDPQGVPGRGI